MSDGAVPRFIVSSYAFAPQDEERLRSALGAAGLLVATGTEALRDALIAHPETDVFCGFGPPDDLLTIAPSLRWLALSSAGSDRVQQAGLVRPDGPLVTTASGIHAVPIGEFVVSLMLMWVRHWPTIIDYQRATTWPDHAQWEALNGLELADATLGVVGLGAIGRNVARLGHAFGMKVIATRRSAEPGQSEPDVDVLLPTSRLHDLLAASDFIVVSVPLTPETHHLISSDELRAMKPTAFLINISRGSTIDEGALIVALGDGTIGGAGLDVFEREPLPSESPLWRMPNVILAPHVAGNSDQYSRRFTDLFLDNLARFRANQPLRNVVDPVRGY